MPVDCIAEGAAVAHTAVADALTLCAEVLLSEIDASDRELSLLLTDDAHIQALNAQWRGEDKPTDVLSFAMDESDDPDTEAFAGLAAEFAAIMPLGDIIISVETAARQGSETGLGLAGMCRFLLVHGLCHLQGHDHAEPEEAAQMRAAEDALWAVVGAGLQRPPTPY
ncbi:MAG: putative rRNA maturation factor [Myxococcota bacterium]